ncbi:unnamed protein product [Closterium sp. NIES-64]|nr:unnamed protein product [Closterium sp. NIES-64]
MIDALVFSLAVYESSPEKVLSVLKSKYDLPVGALDLLHLPDFPGGSQAQQPILVGRSTHGHVVVACRGTADAWDILQDLKIFPRGIRGVGCGTAHMGFVERAESVCVEPLLRLLADGHRLVFTGHSLGGAVSALLALRLLEAAESRGLCTHKGQVQCVTFGAPLFASPSLAELINDKYRDVYSHVVSKNDVVPRLVPLVALLQRVAGGGGATEPMEALRLARFALGLLQRATKIPFASALQAAESLLPGPLRLVLSGACQLLWPARTPQQYAFAGNFLLLDPMAEATEGAVHLAQAEDLSSCVREASFALEIHFDVFNHHLLSTYQTGVTKGIRSRMLAHLAAGNAAVPVPSAPAACQGTVASAATSSATVGQAVLSSLEGFEQVKSKGLNRLRRTRSDLVSLEGRVAPFLPIMECHRAADAAANSSSVAREADTPGTSQRATPPLQLCARSMSFSRAAGLSRCADARSSVNGKDGVDEKEVAAAARWCSVCRAATSGDAAGSKAVVAAATLQAGAKKRRWRFGWFLSTVFRVSQRLRSLSTLSLLLGAARHHMLCPIPSHALLHTITCSAPYHHISWLMPSNGLALSPAAVPGQLHASLCCTTNPSFIIASLVKPSPAHVNITSHSVVRLCRSIIHLYFAAMLQQSYNCASP